MFDKVYGHDRIKNILERMVSNNALHRGLCFYGPGGIGKRLLAREVSKAMLCETQTGCGTCIHCTKFDHGNHPDYQEIEPDGADIKVNQVREISENLHFRPFEARARMIVMDRVELFREEAANAFLKSLEEPPEYVYFILVCADIKALLPTIRSRCQKVAFQTLKDDDKTNILVSGFGKGEHMARRLASISFRRLETEDDAWNLFLKDVKTSLAYLKMMVHEGHSLDYFSDLVRDKAGFPRFLDHLTATLRELTLLAAGLPAQELFHDFQADMKTLSERADASSWRSLWEMVVRLNGDRRRNLNLSLWFNAVSVTELNLMEKAANALKKRMRR